MGLIFAAFLFDNGHVWIRVLLKPLPGKIEPAFKTPFSLWCVKDHIPHGFPRVARHFAPHNAGNVREFLPAAPQFAIERYGGEVTGKPWRGYKRLAGTGDQLTSGPIAPDAIELFAHPPAANIDVGLPSMGQHNRGFFSVGVGS
jgi:hypothetical protein